MVGLGLSNFGLTAEQFMELTPAEFEDALINDGRNQERLWRQDMERMRIQTLALVNIQMEQKNQFSSAEKFMAFPWDKYKPKPKKDIAKTKADVANFKSLLRTK